MSLDNPRANVAPSLMIGRFEQNNNSKLFAQNFVSRGFFVGFTAEKLYSEVDLSRFNFISYAIYNDNNSISNIILKCEVWDIYMFKTYCYIDTKISEPVKLFWRCELLCVYIVVFSKFRTWWNRLRVLGE